MGNREDHFEIGAVYIMKANLASMELVDKDGKAFIRAFYIVLDHIEQRTLDIGMSTADAWQLMGIRLPIPQPQEN